MLTNVLSPHRVLRYALTYLALPTIGAQADGCITNLIIDTDIFSDVEYIRPQLAGKNDAAALLLAATLPNVSLLAVNVNYPSAYSPLAASAILNHYAHATTPIGQRRPYTNASFFDDWAYELGEYASKVAYHYSGGSLPWFTAEQAWDPVQLYRKTLAASADASVTIASIGFFENLAALLDSSGDAYSALDGYELVAEKVKKLVVMGGGYPSGREYNFWGNDPLATAHVVNTWPRAVPVTFLGTEVGEVVLTGARLTAGGPRDDPVGAAYRWYVGYNATRMSWDPLAVAYAVLGLGTWFEYGNVAGYNYVFANGSNMWVADDGVTNQHYLRLAVDNVTVADELDELYLKGARLFDKGE
ncbi:inosine/uridine-preferring nucleoside hydrolase [Karstenula rhodostoma CBS 690.94]|uniref:Inosine/uridine-preferring nucleoside hydrolase n=1 Tax=Karstenula rhodostoma CBS 690.94 TaxID=1392251 RepID=A0A9P4PRJ1_9PLEO|nr:inosine/uridine-preferring nucleoside hydrolase [Karstenula rhodostoma CBS 690.94]